MPNGRSKREENIKSHYYFKHLGYDIELNFRKLQTPENIMTEEDFFELREHLMGASDAVAEYVGSGKAIYENPTGLETEEDLFGNVVKLANMIYDELKVIGVEFTYFKEDLVSDIVSLRLLGDLNKLLNTDYLLELLAPIDKDTLHQMSLTIGSDMEIAVSFEQFIDMLLKYWGTSVGLINIQSNLDMLDLQDVLQERLAKIVGSYSLREISVSQMILPQDDAHE